MAAAQTVSKVGGDAARSPGRHPELLPRAGSLRSRGGHQWKHQSSSPACPRLHQPALPVTESPEVGRPENRIPRLAESRVKSCPFQILVQSRIFKSRSKAGDGGMRLRRFRLMTARELQA